jgi:peptide methionine sulfoxide reductase MsrA
VRFSQLVARRERSIEYDPSVISYAQLLDTFWSLHNPTQRAPEQYKSAIW